MAFRREVIRNDDPFGIPACFYWTVDEVEDWIVSLGYGKYKENFRSHSVNGRKLLTVDSNYLPKMGITHFGDILNLTRHLECLRAHRQPEWYPLPHHKLPKLYHCSMIEGPPGTLTPALESYSLAPRDDRLLRSALSYPWQYLSWDGC